MDLDFVDRGVVDPFHRPSSDFSLDDLDLDVDLDLTSIDLDNFELDFCIDDFPNPESSSGDPTSDVLSPYPDPTDYATVVDAKPEEGSGKRKPNGGCGRGGRCNKRGREAVVLECQDAAEERKRARQLRNRESALLSRQRKKVYVEELEEKVRSLSSVVSDLSCKMAYVVAENASLKQQLGGFYPAVVRPLHYPWIVPGLKVPLPPFPRLRPVQQRAPDAEAKKSERKKDSKIKKVASVSLLGLLFLMIVVSIFVPTIVFRIEGDLNFNGYVNRENLEGHYSGKVLMINDGFERMNETYEVQLYGGSRELQKEKMSCHLPCSESSDGTPRIVNEECLLASLYVPRNDKLVKIDGNSIISYGIAGEKAREHMEFGKQSHYPRALSELKVDKSDLTIACGSALPLSVSTSQESAAAGHLHGYRSRGELHQAISDGLKLSLSNNLLQEWFHEGMEGPLFRSGICKEVFQFDMSTGSSNPAAYVSATDKANIISSRATKNILPRKMSRRVLHSLPRPCAASTLNKANKGSLEPPEDNHIISNKSVQSMVVSVLVDPRGINVANYADGMISRNSISRIFVVVLLDSIKYVTYSCVLPLGSNAHHLVTG